MITPPGSFSLTLNTFLSHCSTSLYFLKTHKFTFQAVKIFLPSQKDTPTSPVSSPTPFPARTRKLPENISHQFLKQLSQTAPCLSIPCPATTPVFAAAPPDILAPTQTPCSSLLSSGTNCTNTVLADSSSHFNPSSKYALFSSL